MKQELKEILYQRYRGLFLGRELSDYKTNMCWGLACGDGWFELIDSLCATVQLGVAYELTAPVTITRIKEKMESLRFYVRTGLKFGGNEWVKGAIEMATMLSVRNPKEHTF